MCVCVGGERYQLPSEWLIPANTHDVQQSLRRFLLRDGGTEIGDGELGCA